MSLTPLLRPRIQKILLVATGLLFLGPGAAEAQLGEGLQVQGFLRFYTGVETDPDLRLLASRMRARVNLVYTYDEGRIYLSNDIRNEFLNDDPSDAHRLGEIRYDLREAFLDLYLGPVDIRLGRQQIVWGEADGAFITDVVNPLDLSEFLTQDFTDIRLGVPALKGSYYTGDVVLTGVLIPRFFPSRIPDGDSPWNPAPETVLGLPVRFTDPEVPDFTLDHGEIATRITYNGVDRTSIHVLYLYAYNRLPAFRKNLALLEEEAFRLDPRITLTPVYDRSHTLGASFSTALTDPFVLRGEFAYHSRWSFDEAVDLTLPFDRDTRPTRAGLARGFLLQKPYLQTMLGGERLFGNHLIRVQGLASVIVEHDDRIAEDPVTPALTALWNGRFLRETLTLQVFSFYNVGRDYWINPSLTYNVVDALNATLGVQWFGGETDSETTYSFALFDDLDFVYLNVVYNF